MRGTGIDSDAWQQHAWLNRLQSVALLGFMGGFLALLGWLLWGGAGVITLLVVGVLGVFLNPSTSPRWVMKMYGASRLGRDQAPGLWSALEVLSQRAGLPRIPDLYYVPSGMLNAFAVGHPAGSAIALTDGLLQNLDDRELLAVLAHEMSHIRNNDLWVMGLADVFSRATSFLSLFGQLLLLVNLPLVWAGSAAINWFAIALLIFAPNLSALAQLALSRTREYDADLNAVRLTGDPQGLARALLKIEKVQGGWLERILLPGRRVPEPSLLRTHPRTEDRVRRLAELAGQHEVLGLHGSDMSQHVPRHVVRPRVARRPRWHIDGLWH